MNLGGELEREMERKMTTGIAMGSGSNITAAVTLLPIGAVAFAPFLLLELVAAIVSNAILLALVILACVKKLNNNINIYLFSLAVGGLIGAFNIFSLMALVVARRWALGLVMCDINYFVSAVSTFFPFIIYLFISRDKLRVVKHPFSRRPTEKRAYIASVITWVVLIGGGIFFIGYSFTNWNRTQDLFIDRGNFICFGLTTRRISSRFRFISLSFIVLGVWVVTFATTMYTASNFVRILLELRQLKKHRLRLAKANLEGHVMRINGQDKPLNHTREERTAKSLTLVYSIQFVCSSISAGMAYSHAIRNFVLTEEDGPDYQLYLVVMLIVQLYPCVNPIFLILSNKRLRIRVKELFKCTLSPETDFSPVRKPKSKAKFTALSSLLPKAIKISPFSYVGRMEGLKSYI